MLYEKIVRDERILAQLDFDSNAVFHKVSLVITGYRPLTSRLNFSLLLCWAFSQCLPN